MKWPQVTDEVVESHVLMVWIYNNSTGRHDGMHGRGQYMSDMCIRKGEERNILNEGG